jgi:hypothetical protein
MHFIEDFNPISTLIGLVNPNRLISGNTSISLNRGDEEIPLDPIEQTGTAGSESSTPKPGLVQPESTQKAAPQTDLNIAAEQEAHIPLWKDFGYFLLHNKKWWLLPILVIVILLGFLMALSSTAIAPFIYTVF